MNLASIEKLALERADQRTQEVFGLLLSYLEQQESQESRKGYFRLRRLIVDGKEVFNLDAVEYSFTRDLTCSLSYSTHDNREMTTRNFPEVKFESNANGERLIFDEKTYIELER